MQLVPKNVAFNPLPWAVTSKGFDFESMPPIEEIFRQIREAGFEAIHAEIPFNRDEATYLSALRASGLNPAPGYFQASFANTEELETIIKRAQEAARFHKKLGLDRIFIAEQFGVEPARMANPGVGANLDQVRLARVVEGLNLVADAMALEGVKPCLHPHVGTLIETEAEIDFVLAGTNENLLFGPDTGHLAWAGMDPARIIRRYRSRIGAVHIKDLHASIAENSAAAAKTYQDTMLAHVWTEPGRGDLGFDSIFEALGGFDGWFVIEVDYSDLGSPESSAEASANWAVSHSKKFSSQNF